MYSDIIIHIQFEKYKTIIYNDCVKALEQVILKTIIETDIDGYA